MAGWGGTGERGQGHRPLKPGAGEPRHYETRSSLQMKRATDLEGPRGGGAGQETSGQHAHQPVVLHVGGQGRAALQGGGQGRNRGPAVCRTETRTPARRRCAKLAAAAACGGGGVSSRHALGGKGPGAAPTHQLTSRKRAASRGWKSRGMARPGRQRSAGEGGEGRWQVGGHQGPCAAAAAAEAGRGGASSPLPPPPLRPPTRVGQSQCAVAPGAALVIAAGSCRGGKRAGAAGVTRLRPAARGGGQRADVSGVAGVGTPERRTAAILLPCPRQARPWSAGWLGAAGSHAAPARAADARRLLLTPAPAAHRSKAPHRAPHTLRSTEGGPAPQHLPARTPAGGA